ncbi:L10-interacting MYB domain-containing protein [Linum grandiflorum]
MEAEPINQLKPERTRTRWSPSLDKVFADLMVKQIQLGNRPNSFFDKKTWNTIRDEFNSQTDVKFNNNQLRKHFDVLRTRYNSLKPAASVQNNDFAMDNSCSIQFDLWEDCSAQCRPETGKVKDCPIYNQLCVIFSDTSGDGKYAQSSHFEESAENGTAHAVPGQEASHPENEGPAMPRATGERKRKQPIETQQSPEEQNRNDDHREAVAEALAEMVTAFKQRKVGQREKKKDEKYSISNCIGVLDSIKGIDERLYFAAVDLLEEANSRETFVSLKGDEFKLAWLQGKCGTHSLASLFGF